MRRLIMPAILIAGFTSLASAQTSALRAAAKTITAQDIQRRINIIADDSMMGRNTPSPGLEKTAQYVADQFRKFGLKPAGEHGTYFQRYIISQRRISVAGSHIGFIIHGKHLHVGLDRDARFAFGSVPGKEVRATAVLLGGGYTTEDAAKLDVKGKAVILVMDYRKPLTPVVQQAVFALSESGPAGIILLSNRDSAAFATRVANQAMLRVGVDGDTGPALPIVEVHERALGETLKEAGINPDEIRASATLVTREVPDLTIGFGLEDQILDSTSAPNTIAVLEGSDPKLKNEYLVYSAHMDHLGTSGGGQCQARGGDTICNGADDDGSGTVSVVELAEAFTQKGARPKRSVIFMTVSGEEKGLWGSHYFSEHPTVPLPQLVADLNIDMIGRNWKDTVVAIGKEHSDLGATLNRVSAEHKDLNIAPIDDRWPEENFYFRSDHYNFARKGVPILFFFNGTHADYHQVSDSPDKIEAEKQSRIVQLLFYLGEDIANAPNRPKWNPESYKKIVQPKPAT
jgi:Peptidase family M28